MKHADEIASVPPDTAESDGLRDLLMTVSDGVIVVDADLCVKSVNQGYLELFGLTPEECLPGTPAAVIYSRLVELGSFSCDGLSMEAAIRQRFPETLELHTSREQRELPDGRVIDVYRQRMTNGDWTNVLIDVTEKVQRTRVLEQQRKLMDSILENTTDGVALVTSEGRYIAFNSRFLEFYRIPPEKVYWGIEFWDLAELQGDIADFSPEDRRAELERRHHFATNPEIVSIRRKLGDGRTLLIHKTVLDDGGCVMTMRNITGELIRERELIEARAIAESSSRQKSEFVATMSHEMRTPLNGILGAAALLERSGLDQQQVGLAEIIKSSGNVLLRLIDDVLDISQIEAETFHLVDEELVVADMIEECVSTVRHTAEDKGLALGSRKRGTSNVLVQGDIVRLKQIVLNLLTNAIKFTTHGEVSLCLRVWRDREIAVHEITVSDTGIGIPEVLRGQIFDRFYQIEGDLTRSRGGAGLGLAIVKKLVDAMGGTIKLDSELARGSTFTVTLPLAIVSWGRIQPVDG